MKESTPTLRCKHCMDVKSFSINHHDLCYIQQLHYLGLKYHSSLFPSLFRLKNGLVYPGIATTTFIGPKLLLVEVPESLILSSIKALQTVDLSDVFSEPFYNEENTWQDRVLTTYLLYLYQSGDTSNVFYQMLEHMSKNIDICCFWSEQELDMFRDPTIKTTALKELELFEKEWDSFSKIQARHSILQGGKITKESYKWILIHVSSRCFGKQLDFTSFVPFCDFFNHHVSSVSYSTDTFTYNN